MDLYKGAQLPDNLKAKYEGEAGRYWDLFYRRNEERFFKDRHWFADEFPQLLAAQTVLEVGCGAGNSVFPLLALNPSVSVLCCDFAPSAVELVQRHPQYQQHAASGRLRAFVADITGDDLAASVAPASVDVCTMIFVLSAVPPHAMRAALRNVGRALRPGGQLLFRDYAEGDLAQGRLAGQGRQQRLEEGCYVRWDGTLAAYFTEAGLRQLFESEGFHCDSCRPVGKLMENRRTGEQLDRRFVQAVFTYQPAAGQSGVAAASSEVEEAGAGGAGGTGSGSAACGGQALRGGECGQPGQQGEQQQQEDEESEEEVQLALGSTTLRFRCRQHAHPLGRAAAEALAAAVLACPWLSLGADVLELCSWDAPLASLAALRYCRRAVAAGWDTAAVERLRGNARRNGCSFVIERLRLTPLAWRAGDGWQDDANGEQQQQQQDGEQQEEEGEEEADQQQDDSPLLAEQLQRVQQACSAGFQTVLAAVPAAPSQADLRRLLRCAATLLSRQPHSRILLCAGAADIDRARQAAVGEQLKEAEAPADLQAAVQGGAVGGNQPLALLLLAPACR